jgi:DNA polymerase-4
LVNPDQRRKSVSAETTFDTDLSTLGALEDRLWPCCEKVASRARAEAFCGRSVVLKLKTSDFLSVTRRKTLEGPTQTAKTIFAAARALLAAEVDGTRFRLIGVGLADLCPVEAAPPDLFADPEARARRTETLADTLRARFGAAALVSGRALDRS